MPELPEVENVKLSLENQGLHGETFASVTLLRANLRTRLRPELRTRLPGQSVRVLERRAKYLLWHTDDYTLISHLGMTGSWRFIPNGEEREKHDHILLRFKSGKTLVFNDPRRFGIFELVPRAEVYGCRWLKHLGCEPLSKDFDSEYLFELSRKRKTPIKALIMDQRHVVGVGNIYASEALHRARVSPCRLAGKITRREAGLIVDSIRTVLSVAIQAGGSTIRDYRNSKGEGGRFQSQFFVYDRLGEACAVCGQNIRSKFISGRNTFWCPQCQR